jgi:hypothetical protein
MSLAALCLLPSVPSAVPASEFDAQALYAIDAGPQQSFEDVVAERHRRGRLHWEPEQMVLQGFVGANIYDTVSRTGGASQPVDGSGAEASQMPALGGGAQWKLAGERLDFGLEAMFSFGGRANATAFVAGGGGAAVAVNIDMLAFELYGGPFVSCFIGERARVYASTGPLMEWADYNQEFSDTGSTDSGTGFGTGWYARTGFEFALSDNTLIGFGVRWSEATVDLDSGLGELSVEGMQYVFTVTEGF